MLLSSEIGTKVVIAGGCLWLTLGIKIVHSIIPTNSDRPTRTHTSGWMCLLAKLGA